MVKTSPSKAGGKGSIPGGGARNPHASGPINENIKWGASLVAQWFRIRLPMQGTRVQSLVQEDPTCRRATKPVRHNY